jgi:hypothetical protein
MTTVAAHISHDRDAPVHIQIVTTLHAIAMPRLPPLPSTLAITHTHVAARARVAAASKARVHSGVATTTKDRIEAAAQACRGIRIALLGWHKIHRCLL